MSLTRDFIFNTIEHYYNKPKLSIDEKSEEALSDFINNPQALILHSFVNDEDVFIYTKIQENKNKSIVFYKISAEDLLKDDSVNNINILTLSSNAAESLYQIWRQIYTPLLAVGNDLYSSKLQKNLTDLESNLRILAHGKGNTNINIIMSIEDELDYWRTVGEKRDSNKKEREAASTFCELFEDVMEEIRLIQSSPMTEIRESAENIGGILDDVWRFTPMPYKQDRMVHVFDIIGHTICTSIQNTFSDVNLWQVHEESKGSELLNLLSESLKVIQTWNSACESLTDTYWPNYALHAWDGKPYVPTFCVNFHCRLKEIYDIRSIHSQLNKLLSTNERSELQTNLLFGPFENINIWIYNGPNPAWESATSKFSTSLRAAETKVAEKLKPRLHNISTKQMLYEFMRYSALIERPLVKHALNNELEIFVTSLISMLKSIQRQMDSDEVDVKMYQPAEMSSVVHQVQWAKQMEAKVKKIQTCAEKYLKEFEGSGELLSLAGKVLKDLTNMYTQLHEEWCRDLQAQAKNGSLQISVDKPVVEFSGSSRMMVVNFNPALVRAELEARMLAALGLPPPPAAAALHDLTHALAHARPLHQVASFHNTLGERMIPSTRPMMLQAALDLSNLVQDQKAVYWDDVEQLVNYTDKLKKIVLKLETQNTYLTGQHVSIRNIVQKLMDTELLSKQSEWKKAVKDIRDIIDTVESNGYKNTELWRTHWDWQLYKALEYQYIKTLLSLHKHFPHVKVDLVLRGHRVRVQPAIEELRVQHYHQLRRLVAMPAHFVPVHSNIADTTTIFATIVDKHSWLGNKAVKQLETALSSLEASCESWTRRAALACVPDLDALCSQHLTEPQHWEANFKACKAYGQAVAKMTFEDEKIEWISVGTATLRREFEAQARSLWGALMSSLLASCRADAARLDAFVAAAAVMLERNTTALPRNAKELGDISATQQALQQQMPEMEKNVEALKRKSHMLRTWGGDNSVDGTMKEWQKIHELMLSQQKMFEHQAEIVKSSLSGEWENLNSTVEAWTSRWSQAKSRLEDTHDVQFTEMLDRCRSVFEAHAQWNKYISERDDLMKECEKFNMEIELSETWEQAEKLMAEYVTLWTALKDYSEEFDSIAEQDWIVFQKKIHLIEEFTMKWKERLEPFTAVTLYIQQELDKYSDLTPLLKYLRGNEFTERHWREVYSLLEIEYKKPDTLQVKDVLGAATNIKKHIKALQKICTSASSEFAIRNALNELEIWFAGARLTITYYNDKAKRPTPIVKDFKDILSKIEEQQWVVSSLAGGAGGAGGGAGGPDACGAWGARLRAARALLRATHHAQRRWLYLEPILSNDDGELGVKFRKVDQGFRQVTRILESDARLSALLQSSRLQPMLDSISEQLVACQSALNLYIDEKRSIFPRLYFLSDDDLLELLGQARGGADGRRAVIQTHLKKLFPGITGVRLGPGDMSITALCSHYNETFQLDHPVDIDCPVEVWLKNLETEMRASLKNMTLKCIITNSLHEQDPFSLPTQILCLAQNIRFTEQAERAITTKELHKLKDNVEKENGYYASAEIEDESEQKKRQALILQCAHYLSVIRILIDNNVVSTSDWFWQKQLRFYLLSNKEVVAKMGLAQISYSYEYLGVNTGQFVRTELADDCFFILTQSLHLGFVGNPFGPAGTGKTESVKALGSLVGRLVLIFNCDEAVDAECMGRLLSGVALCGAWGCFDEFNRLAADTLAAAAHQLASLLSASVDRAPGTHPTAILNGKQIAVSEWCGVAATLNPAGRGYGGRRALPDALQRLLRPIAMLQPPHTEVAARLLAANCVPDSQLLATDLNNVFTLASSLLSSQRHYDWGLRALKAAVGSCAAALRARAPRDVSARRAAVRTVLTLNNLSKLTTHDAHRFENILSLVFNDVPVEESSSDPIASSLETTVDNLKLVHNKLQIQKCVELYEQLQQRMGVVIVGPPGSGKTTIRRLLKSALALQGKNVVEYIICPKAMSREWLLGSIDHDTRQWTDGVISSTALEISNQPPDVWSWVVMDGDVEPEWVEALNSVLDDNRLLTLPSGWRVQFAHNVNFVFETHCLRHASPATVSRMGIILLSDDVSCDLDVLTNWIQRADFDNEHAKSALPLLEQAVKKCVQWLNEHQSDLALKIYNISVVKQILTQFEYLAQDTTLSSTRSTPEEMVYLAIERSVVDVLKDNAIDSFHEEMSSLLGPPVTMNAPLVEWVSDSLLMSRRLLAHEAGVRACLSSHDGHLLIVGPDASAKNILAEYLARECNSTLITIDCTPILEPADIISELKRNNVVWSGGGGGGRGSGALLVRALHRAPTDAWGSTHVHAFLLQLIQHNGFWSRGSDEEGSGVQWWNAAQLRLVATATHTAAVDTRLAAALLLTQIGEPDDEELSEILTNYLKNSVGKGLPSNEISSLADKILTMYKEVTETFFNRSHYKWNASHLKKLCENVKWYSPTNMEQLLMAIGAEANFIFRERLVSEEEKAVFNSIYRKHLKTNNETMYFAYKLRGDGVYLEHTDYNDWYQRTQKLINQCLSENEQNVFGDTGAEVCSELAILCSAMARTTNGGLLVCVGCAGVGRLAAAHIVAAALPAALFVIKHETNFNNIFKNALCSAGGGARTLALALAGAAPARALAALEALRRARSDLALPPPLLPAARDHCFLANVKENLAIIICLDKSQENLSELMDKYPLLYNDGNVVWIERWCDETLREVPRLLVQRLLKENAMEASKEQLDALPVDGFVNIHKSVDVEWKRAPCRYVNFVKTYYNINSRKKTALLQRQVMLSAGVEGLRRARSGVARLQGAAAQQDAALRGARARAAAALQQIGATVRANTQQKDDMHALKRNIEVENEHLQARKKEIEAELAAVEPIIAAARAAVGDIRPESLSEVRSLRAPPEVVRDVLEGVLRLMGIADTSWHSMKNFLSKRGVKEDIRCLDASQISPATIASVQRLLESRGASFEAAAAKRASAACAPLAAWVRANLHYAAALQRVQPLQAHQAKLHKNLTDAEQQMAALSTGLATVEERVAALQEQLGQHTRDAAALELQLTNANDTITAATDLLDQLAHEYTAWETDLENISIEISQLTQRSLLAAAYIVYLPDVTEPQAREYVTKWSSLINFDDTSFSIINFLSSTEKQLKWEADGLPSDTSAIKNAVLVDQYLESQKCGFTPLIVDPDGEGLAWLKNTLADSNCDFVPQQSDKLTTAVQYAARLSRTLVISDVDGVHPCWSSGAGAARLLLQCRAAPCLPPHVTATLAPLNFTHTLHALQDQLVHYALQQQNPEVDAKFKEIKLKKATLQKQQHELQEKLLRELSNKDDILQDAGFLASLSAARAATRGRARALAAAPALHAAARAAAAALAPAARRAAALALGAADLAARWPRLKLPLDFVQDVFVDAVRKQPDQNKINNEDVVKYLTRKIVERVLLSLHKKDKYVVVLYLLKQVYEDLIPNELWQHFIGNYDLLEDAGNVKEIKNKYAWLPEDCAMKILKLKLANEDLYNRMSLDNEGFWKEFQQSGDINIISKLKLSAFETVVAVAATRPDSVYRAIVAFVDQILGAGVMRGGPGASAAHALSSRRGRTARPVLLLAAHAYDALAAAATGRALTYVGIDEGRSAWEQALESSRGGGWLAIVVGASPLTHHLQAFIASYLESPAEQYHEEFRLWILCEDRDIPPLISNSCVNVILEAPEGVKNNVMSTLSAWGKYTADANTVRLHAALALFHALVQERRAYIPQGWSQWYAWEWGEAQAGARALRGGACGRACAALYAARVCAGADERALGALQRRYLGAPALAPHWRPAPLAHPLPTSTDLQEYVVAFDGLPNIDTPALLALPANCRVAWEKNTANDIISRLKELNSTVSIRNKNDSVTPLKSLLSLWKKLMSGSPFIKGEYQNEKASGGAGGWWWSVCDGEARDAARAARAVHVSLAQRARAHQSAPHRACDEWHMLWSGPAEAHAYVRELGERARAALARLDGASLPPDYMPAEVDLRSFVRPSRVAWALRVRTAARLACPVHALVLSVKWDCATDESGDGLVVVGLRLSGAEWRGGALSPVAATAPPHVAAPPLRLRYVPQQSDSAVTSESSVEVPVYTSAAREARVLSARAPLAPHWERDSAALHAPALYIAPYH